MYFFPGGPNSASGRLSAQLNALENSSRNQDCSPVSPGNQKSSNIGKSEIKQEIDDDIKPDMEAFENTESNSNSEFGGKNSNSDMIKVEPKTESMDVDNASQSDNIEMDAQVKEEDESSTSTMKAEIKPMFPEPVQTTSTDKQKKCCKLSIICFYYSNFFFCWSFVMLHIIISYIFTAFKPDELRQALMPTMERLYRQDPESIPFRQPVDPTQLGIPDYFDIVKRPMDLSTIKNKLTSGKYTDPWEYVDDVWLMFDNAWLYNRKTSRVYRYCTKVNNLILILSYNSQGVT